MVNQFEIYFLKLDPTFGSEVRKTRPCVILSPESMNNNLNTIIIAPVTSTLRNYPTRLNLVLQNRMGQIMLDQLRSVDKSRLINSVGNLNQSEIFEVKNIIKQMLVD